MSTGAVTYAPWTPLEIALTILGVIVYFVPTMIAIARKADLTAQVVVLNLFFGWTVGVWVVCLIMALRPKRPKYIDMHMADYYPFNQPTQRR